MPQYSPNTTANTLPKNTKKVSGIIALPSLYRKSKMSEEQKMTECDYCHREFPTAELRWVKNTSVLSCVNCMIGAEQDFEDFCREDDD